MLTTSSAKAIATRTDASFDMYITSTPCIISFLIAAMYHRAGIIPDSHCSRVGMLSMGNRSPEKNMTGIIKAIPEMSMAATCVFTNVEINKPNDKETTINSGDITINQQRLPAIGTPKTKTAIRIRRSRVRIRWVGNQAYI
ncbi:hypothetical protein EZS27_033919 [termite gut metagenome]|uniref:Uncharacterized protein n=1 Tax=termite gut metagenome TaxID=433724 RepID=A0A5J4Q444_9ZZZZ